MLGNIFELAVLGVLSFVAFGFIYALICVLLKKDQLKLDTYVFVAAAITAILAAIVGYSSGKSANSGLVYTEEEYNEAIEEASDGGYELGYDYGYEDGAEEGYDAGYYDAMYDYTHGGFDY